MLIWVALYLIFLQAVLQKLGILNFVLGSLRFPFYLNSSFPPQVHFTGGYPTDFILEVFKTKRLKLSSKTLTPNSKRKTLLLKPENLNFFESLENYSYRFGATNLYSGRLTAVNPILLSLANFFLVIPIFFAVLPLFPSQINLKQYLILQWTHIIQDVLAEFYKELGNRQRASK
jgi:hypothetical protein